MQVIDEDVLLWRVSPTFISGADADRRYACRDHEGSIDSEAPRPDHRLLADYLAYGLNRGPDDRMARVREHERIVVREREFPTQIRTLLSGFRKKGSQFRLAGFRCLASDIPPIDAKSALVRHNGGAVVGMGMKAGDCHSRQAEQAIGGQARSVRLKSLYEGNGLQDRVDSV